MTGPEEDFSDFSLDGDLKSPAERIRDDLRWNAIKRGIYHEGLVFQTVRNRLQDYAASAGEGA